MMQKNQCLLLLVLFLLSLDPVRGQTKPAGPGTSPLCTKDNALEMIRQQVGVSKDLYNSQRIAVLVRAADLLWPYQQDKARASFAEAFDEAIKTESDPYDVPPRPQVLILRLQGADQRFVVIRAVAKRDSAWARELVQSLTKRDAESAEIPPARDSFDNVLIGNRLMLTASQMLATDYSAALELARLSLNYPVSFNLTRFLYQLAAISQGAADQLYSQALAAYGDKPMREFLYLQAYPFAWRETLMTPVFTFHDNVPANFAPNQSLQRRLVQLMLRRAQQTLESPLEQKDAYLDQSANGLPSTAHILDGLIQLEPNVKKSLPDLLPALTEMREKILVSLSVENQKLFMQPGREASIAAKKTFAERIESAQKVSDVDERDELIASAVLGSHSESLASVVQAVDMLSDSTLRASFFEWLYFQRAHDAVTNKQFEEAEKLAAKVEGLEQRAFLHAQIAKGLLNRNDSLIHGREVLDEAITEAKKAGVTIFAARTQLTAAVLYMKIDLNRSIEALADAVNCVNRLKTPDFVNDDQVVEKRLDRRGRGGRDEGDYLLRFYMPGADPETAFRELAKLDLDTALAQSNTLKDKFQRAMSTLALADACLQQSPPKAKKRNNARLITISHPADHA